MKRYFKSNIFIITVIILCLSFPLALFPSPKVQHFELSRFISGSILFNTIFGDGQGKRVENISKAREILRDHRLPQEAADRLMGQGKVIIPLVVMAETSKTFK
jgi:hypothetical protein